LGFVSLPRIEKLLAGGKRGVWGGGVGGWGVYEVGQRKKEGYRGDNRKGEGEQSGRRRRP